VVEFCVLGPLRVRGDDGAERIVGGARQQVLLAALLVRAGHVVSTDTLAGYLWDGAPPPSARATVQSYVMRLRRQLGPAAGARLTTKPSGYLMDVGEELDLHRFGRLERTGRQAAAAGAWEPAVSAFAEALALWRGEPLADVPSDALHREECGRFAEARLTVTELWAEAALRAGRARDVVPELSRLCAAHQYREWTHALLMTALYRSGRRVDALRTFTAVRNRLVEDIGVEPGPRLAELQASILADDPALADNVLEESRPGPNLGVTSEPSVMPRQLPGAVRHFTGRADELRALTALIEGDGIEGGDIEGGDKTPGAAVITALSGMGGVGKTALAVHWAHQVGPAFPDGQLYVDLRGFSPDAVPVAPAEAVGGFLEALGVPSSQIPVAAEVRYALYRSLIADKRTLVVLDNARDAAQVRPLLPGTASCVALVTSRRRLTSLAAAEGAHLLELDVLDPAAARDLVIRQLGVPLSRVEVDAVDELVRHCCGLPLALSVAAARAAGRPDRLVLLVEDLRRERGRLAVLTAGDLATDVRKVFSWSFRELDDPSAWMFRVLGLHPGREITVPAAASVAGCSPGDARRALEDLTEAHLLTAPSPGGYAMHGLLKAYAAEQAADSADSGCGTG
jgi:DNA-binding SARP family transcriptional activator